MSHRRKMNTAQLRVMIDNQAKVLTGTATLIKALQLELDISQTEAGKQLLEISKGLLNQAGQVNGS